MEIKGINIYDPEIEKITHPSTRFANGKATVEVLDIHFANSKYSNNVSGIMSLSRKQAIKLIKELELHLKVRTSKRHFAWCEKRGI